MLEDRPHRAARAPDAAATELRKDARAGRLDGDAVAAVLASAGHEARVRPERPSGVSDREVEVLRLLAATPQRAYADLPTVTRGRRS